MQYTFDVFCTTIIPTVGRDSLARAVTSVLTQTFTAAHEVIVVNDSERPLPAAPWQTDTRVHIIETQQREKCVARNTGAALAHGTYLHFLDDDDWLLPDALTALYQTAQQNHDAAWIYGTARFEDPQGKLVGTINLKRNGNCFTQVVAGQWIPLQASLIRADTFFAVGGFHPTMFVTEDLDLARRIGLVATFAGTETEVACILRGQDWGSTSNYEAGPEWVRWGRDRILAEPGAFARLLASADDGFWHGRIFHAYLTTALYNIRQRRFGTAFTRGTLAAAALLRAGKYAFTAAYWRALRTHHVGRDFH
ncbi:MAG: glycosyltransferase family 2 protein [Anaerolineales bacterium]|nr:glycosyltransferase family 2 protein [Anaerolineales bacterium]